MPRQDTVDFLTAFAVGTVLGIGATLLLQPERSTRARLVRQLKPHQKQLRRSAQQIGAGVRGSGAATADMTGELISAGRELLGEFRAEVAEILSDARGELQDMGRGPARGVKRGVKQTRRKLGM